MKNDFSIITPSYNMLSYLKCCCASVSDQKDISFEHIVVDGQSTDGTIEWLKTNKNKNIRSIIEKDNGMYDAINKGLKKASGDILAFLNCDEQYLPGTLEYVKNYFSNNPSVDVIFGNFLVINHDGNLIAFRKAHQPYKLFLLSSYLYVFTCTMFLRKKVIDSGIHFNTNYKSVGDLDFILQLMSRGFNVKYVQKYFSVFMHRNNNLMYSEKSINETKEYIKERIGMYCLFSPVINLIRLIIKFISGAYSEKAPLKYEIYTLTSDNMRKEFIVHNLNFRMRNNH